MNNDLTRCNPWMFRKVRCTAYLKRIKDGRFIEKDKDGNCTYVDTSRIENGNCWSEEVPEGDYDGTRHFLKTYYQYKEKKFIGIVVGMKMVILTGYLVVDTNYQFDGSEYTFVKSEPESEMKCALVYYGCNKSRYVPMDNLEIMEE